MWVVGLTGGIGSGKTAASDHFKHLGIKIVDADIASRTVVEPGKPALQKIADYFGSDIVLSNHQLNRSLLREKIFANPKNKQWLEALLHPLIAEEIQHGIESAQSPYAIFVSPLLVESKQISLCNRLLVIDVPEELQLARTIERDNNDSAQVQRIIASQASRQQRLNNADDVIVNTADLGQLQHHVEKLHQQYLKLAEANKST